MAELKHMQCVPCRGGEPTLSEDQIQDLKPQVPEWEVIDLDGIQRLQRTFKFKDFAQALAFTNRVGGIAEEQDHHPVLKTAWGRVTVTWWTHAIKGLHQNDFIMAARTDELYNQ